jgi:hypothetical protein
VVGVWFLIRAEIKVAAFIVTEVPLETYCRLASSQFPFGNYSHGLAGKAARRFGVTRYLVAARRDPAAPLTLAGDKTAKRNFHLEVLPNRPSAGA